MVAFTVYFTQILQKIKTAEAFGQFFYALLKKRFWGYN